MSRWLRIGTAISILWLVGLPIYLLVDTKQLACLAGATAQQSCNVFSSEMLSFAVGALPMVLLLAPIAIFWILVGVTFWTIGVVISILWLIGEPIYVLAGAKQFHVACLAGGTQRSCQGFAYETIAFLPIVVLAPIAIFWILVGPFWIVCALERKWPSRPD